MSTFNPEDFGAVEIGGFNPDDFGATPSIDQAQTSLAHSQATIDRLRMEAQQAEQAAQQANSFGGMALQTAKDTTGSIANPIAKGLATVGSSIKEFFGGKPITQIKGTQGEIIPTSQGKILADTSLKETSVGGEFVDTALNVGSIIPVGKGLSLGKQAVAKSAEKLAPIVSPFLKKLASPATNFLAKRAEKKAIETATRAVTPKTADLSEKEYELLLKQGRVTPKTMFSAPKYVLSDKEKTSATRFKDLLQDKDPVKNSIKVMSRIADEDAQVGQFLEKNNGVFNSGELRNSISEKLKDVTDVAIPEARVNKLKTTITDNFLKSLQKNDMKSLWEARKEFDRQIENAFSGSPSLQKEVKRKFRNAVQEFISERTPDGVYSGKMRDMSDLFGIEEKLADIASKSKGSGQFKQWLDENPTTAKVIGATLVAGGGGTAWGIAN